MHEWLNGKDSFFGLRGVFAYETAVGGKKFIQGYSSFTNISREYLQGRKYIVTLWDYKPGVYMLDETYDSRTNKRIPFRNEEERIEIEAYGASEHARLDKALRTPYTGVF